MRVWTSYINNCHNLPKDIHPIFIWWRPIPEFSGDRYKPLAPKRNFWQKWDEMRKSWNSNANNFYIENYKSQVLACLSTQKVIEDLNKISWWKDIALVCLEEPDKFCHRHLVSEWLRQNGIPCKEFSNELFNTLSRQENEI